METDFNSFNQNSTARSMKFYFMSSIGHVVFFSLAIIVGALMPKPVLPAITEITILDSGSPAPSVSLSAPPPAAAKPSPQQEISEAPTTSATPDKDVVVIPKAKMVPAKQARSKYPSKSVEAQKSSAQSAASANQAKTHFQGPTVAVSDVEAPVLETEDFEKALKSKVDLPTQQLKDSDIADDLDKVDNEQSAKVAALKQSVDQETAGALAEQEASLKAAQSETQAQAEVMNKNAAAMKAADRARIQQAVSAERASAQAAQAAKEKAAAQAASQAAAQQAAAQAASQAAARAAAAQAEAAAVYGRQMALGNSLGVNAPVRSLSEIKQVPGNKRPEYPQEARLAQQEGEVSFLAFIGANGKISQVKLLKSAGHRSLDAQTLSAIRDWKFYPGQEGWVEIPFNWSLKGGAQEMPSTLRRSLSQK